MAGGKTFSLRNSIALHNDRVIDYPTLPYDDGLGWVLLLHRILLLLLNGGGLSHA